MFGAYNANVRIGNWFDELMMQEEILKQYLRKSSQFKLKVQGARNLFCSMLTEVPLGMAVRGLFFGSAIQIMSTEAPTDVMFGLKKKQGMVLAANVEYSNIDERSGFWMGDQVVGTGLLTPCVRNVWTLVPCDRSLNNKPIKFGDEFLIRIHTSKIPLFLEAPPALPSVPTGECGQVIARLTSVPTNLTRFKILAVDTTARYETEGDVVSPFEKVVLQQSVTGQALAIECDNWLPTYFGMDCEISVKNYFVDYKAPYRHSYKNFWSIVLSL